MMDDIDLDYLRRHYDSLADEELIRIYKSGTVTDSAGPVLLEELQKRGIEPSRLPYEDKPAIVTKQLSKGTKEVIASVICVGIFIAYVIISVTVFEWKHGGGVIPILVLVAALTGIWRSITK